MAKIISIIVVQKTADIAHAGTDDGFYFEITLPGSEDPIRMRFPNLPSDERERGKVDAYSFNVVKHDLDTGHLGPSHTLDRVTLGIRALGDNAWKPDAIHIYGMLENGEMLRLGERRGSLPWLSTDISEGEEVLLISL